jgi:UPF0716 protein FxsA
MGILKKLIIAFIVISVIELLITSYLGGMLGGLGTLIWCIVSAIVGFYIIKLNISLFSGNFIANLSHGLFDTTTWYKLIFALSGVLLILPGFTTDIISLILIIPITRNMFVMPLIKYFINKIINKF